MIRYRAPEYGADGSFRLTEFVLRQQADQGWELLRDGKPFQNFGPGFHLLRSRCCGICATDLARRFLPHPLPQVIGHETVVQNDRDRLMVVEINASHRARGHGDCPFCKHGFPSHCSDRVTLGINRLPGGFAPYLLAPKHGLYTVPKGISPFLASMTEPLAAALRGVALTPPRTGDRVAVLGPGRLGSLLLGALVHYRQEMNRDFEISALARHQAPLALARELGVDQALDLREKSPAQAHYDVVFDTTGRPEGLDLALNLAKRVVHLKSTHGAQVLGMRFMTQWVVDELALLPFGPEVRLFLARTATTTPWPPVVFVSKSLPPKFEAEARHVLGMDCRFHRMCIHEARSRLIQGHFPRDTPLFRFDLAVVSSPAEADSAIRSPEGKGPSLVRPGGALLLANRCRHSHPLARALSKRGLQLHSSRCGSLPEALDLLQKRPDLARVLENRMITHRFPLHAISQAFAVAADSSQSIKVVVETQPSLFPSRF